MAQIRALAASGEQITATEDYVSSALTQPVQAYLPTINDGTSSSVNVGHLIEVEVTVSGSVELLTPAGRRAGIVGPYSSAIFVAKAGTAQSVDQVWQMIETRPLSTSLFERQKDVIVSNAQALALNATPITIVEAPAAGKAIIFEGAIIQTDAGTAYTIAAGKDLAFKYTGAAGLQVGGCETTGFIDQATAQVRFVRPQGAALGAGTASDITPVAAAALVLHMLVGEVTLGTSPLHVRVFYRIVPTTLPVEG